MEKRPPIYKEIYDRILAEMSDSEIAKITKNKGYYGLDLREIPAVVARENEPEFCTGHMGGNFAKIYQLPGAAAACEAANKSLDRYHNGEITFYTTKEAFERDTWYHKYAFERYGTTVYEEYRDAYFAEMEKNKEISRKKGRWVVKRVDFSKLFA